MKVTAINNISEIIGDGVFYENSTGQWYLNGGGASLFILGHWVLNDPSILEGVGNETAKASESVTETTMLKALAIAQNPELAKDIINNG